MHFDANSASHINVNAKEEEVDLQNNPSKITHKLHYIKYAKPKTGGRTIALERQGSADPYPQTKLRKVIILSNLHLKAHM